MEILKLPIADLFTDPANARVHSKANIKAIKSSLKRFGQQKPIVVDEKGIIIAGNGTFTAASELGWETIAAVRTELKGTDLVAFGIADNRTSELASWNDDELSRLIKSLNESDFDMDATGFDDNEITTMLMKLEKKEEEARAALEREGTRIIEEAETGESETTAEVSFDDTRAPGRYFDNLTPVIQYNLVFENTEQQEQWYDFIQNLKNAYPDEQTIAGRISLFLEEIKEEWKYEADDEVRAQES